MADTRVVEHVHDGGSDNGMGMLLGIIFLIVFLVLLFYYGLPMMRGATTTTPQMNVPGKIDGQIDVNVNK